MLGGRHLERAQPQDVPRVVVQGPAVGVGGQRRGGELRVLDQRRVRVHGQDVAERQPPGGPRGAEVHQLRHGRVEHGPLGPDEPAREVLEEGGAGGRQQPGRPGVEDVPAPQRDPGTGRVPADDLGSAAGQVAHGLHRRRRPAQPGGTGEPAADERLEGVGAQHLVAQLRQVRRHGVRLGGADPQPGPGGGQRPVVRPRRAFPEAPGPRRRAQRTRRRVDERDGQGRTAPRRAQVVGQAQPRGPGADDDHIEVGCVGRHGSLSVGRLSSGRPMCARSTPGRTVPPDGPHTPDRRFAGSPGHDGVHGPGPAAPWRKEGGRRQEGIRRQEGWARCAYLPDGYLNVRPDVRRPVPHRTGPVRVPHGRNP